MLEFQWISQEEHGGVVPDNAQIALACVELDGESTWITPRVGATPLARNSGEADQQFRLGGWLEDGRPGEVADVLGESEYAECAATLGMWLVQPGQRRC